MAAVNPSKWTFLENALIAIAFFYLLFVLFFKLDVADEESANNALISFSSFLPIVAVKIIGLIIYLFSFRLVFIANSSFKFVENAKASFIVLPLIFAILFPELLVRLEAIISLLLLSSTLLVLIQLHQQTNAKGILFSSAILHGLALLFNVQLLWLFLFFIASIYILRGIKIKDLLVTLIGLFLPLFYYVGIAYLLDYSNYYIDLNVNFTKIDFKDNWGFISLLLLFVITAFLSGVQTFISRMKMTVHNRDQLSVYYLYAFGALLLAFFSDSFLSVACLAIIPLSLFYGIMHKKVSKVWILDSLWILLLIFYVLVDNAWLKLPFLVTFA